MGLLGRLGCVRLREAAGTAGTAGVIVGAVRAVIWAVRVPGTAGAGRLGAGIGFGTGFPQGLVEGLLVQAGSVEGVAAAAVRQGQPGRGADVLLGHHTAQIWRSAASGRSTPGRRSRASATCRASAAVSSPKRVTKPAGSASKASL